MIHRFLNNIWLLTIDRQAAYCFVTEVSGIILFSTPIEYKMGCLASIPIGSNVFSELKTYDKKYRTLYHMNYVFLKMFSIFTSYSLLVINYSLLTSKKSTVCALVLLALIHSMQMYFCYLISIRLRTELLAASLLCAILACTVALQYWYLQLFSI